MAVTVTDKLGQGMPSKPKRKPAGRKRRPLTSREKVRAHRARLRAQGLRPVTLWLPDMRSPEFAAQAHRDSLAIANSPSEKDDQAFIDSVSWWNLEDNTNSRMKTGAGRSPQALAIADLIGSVDGLPADLSARKKSRLKATGYGRKRPR